MPNSPYVPDTHADVNCVRTDGGHSHIVVAARTSYDIVHLVDRPQAAATLQQWFIDEWTPWYGPNGQGDAAADLAACAGRDTLPICLVALDARGLVAGTIALKTESVGSDSAPGPWLAALLVGRPYRGRGVATALVSAIADEARRLGYGAIYTSTDSAADIMRRQGWQACGEAASLRGTVSIFRRDLKPESASDA